MVVPAPVVEFAFGDNAFATSPTWVNSSSRVRQVQIDRGRTDPFQPFAPSVCVIELDNNDGELDPFNLSGTYVDGGGATEITPGTQVRVRSTTTGAVGALFQGFVDTWNLRDSFKGDSWVDVTCVDGLSILGRYTITDATDVGTVSTLSDGNQYLVDDAATLIEAVLDHVGWPSAWQSIDADLIDEVSLPVGSNDTTEVSWNALALIQRICDAAYAQMYIGPQGVLNVISRYDLVTATRHTTAQVTLDDDATYGASTLAWTGVDAGNDLLLTRNRVSVSWGTLYDNGVEVESGSYSTQDATSVTRHGVLEYARGDSVLVDTEASKVISDWLLGVWKDPIARVRSVSIQVTEASGTAYHNNAVNRQILDRIRVRATPTSGDRWDFYGLIEGIQHTISTRRWETTWTLSPAEAVGFGTGDWLEFDVAGSGFDQADYST